MIKHYYRKICRQISSYWTVSPGYPSSSNPISTSQSQMQIHQAQEQQQITTKTLLPYSIFIANATLSQTRLIPAPTLAPKPKLLNHSSTPHLSTQPMNLANRNTASCSELPQPMHTVSNREVTPQVISFISDTSVYDSLVFNSLQLHYHKIQVILLICKGPVTNFDRLHSKLSAITLLKYSIDLPLFTKFTTSRFPRYSNYNHS